MFRARTVRDNCFDQARAPDEIAHPAGSVERYPAADRRSYRSWLTSRLTGEAAGENVRSGPLHQFDRVPVRILHERDDRGAMLHGAGWPSDRATSLRGDLTRLGDIG